MNLMVMRVAAFGAAMMLALPAFAGGRGVVICPANTVATYDRVGQASCVALSALNSGGAVEVVVAEQRQGGFLRPRVLCPYPHRASDSVFSGGSGYIIKDDVRRANGCR